MTGRRPFGPAGGVPGVRTWVLPLAVAGIGCLLWVWHTPPVGDLAAQSAWAGLSRRSGAVPWFGRWYGGVPVGGYSLITPPAMGWLGVRAVGVLATLATAVAGAALLARARRPVAGAGLLALAAVADLYSGRVTFAAGGAIALAAVLAAERGRPAGAAVLAAVATVTSPVAGLFLLLPAAVYLLVDLPRRRAGLALAVAAAGVLAGLAALFPAGGREPFADFVFRPAVQIPLGAAILPVGRRVRAGLLLAAAAITAAYLLPTPVGSNATRLSLLLAVPAVVAAARLPAVALVPAAVVLGIWPWHQLHDDLRAAHDASARTAFTAGLADRLAGDPLLSDHRLEVVSPRTHWPDTVLTGRGISLARGWIRQADEGRNPQLYGRPALTPAGYRAFLDRNAVGYVAVPRGVPIDFGSSREAALIAAGLDYLAPVWSGPHWTLYAVGRPAPLVTGPATVTRLTDTGAELVVSAPGRVGLALRWAPWLVVDGGQVDRDGDRVVVTFRRTGRHVLHAAWRLP